MKRTTFNLLSRGSLEPSVTRGKTAQVLIATLVLLLALWICSRLPDLIKQDFACMDFAAYWSSARLLLAGENPYSSERLESLQRSVGWTHPEPLIPYNPPSTLTYLLPFSAGNYVVSKLLWFVFMVSLTFIGIHWLWNTLGGKKELRLWPVILLGTFSPVYFMIAKGQIVPIVLIGLVGFLYFQKQRQDLLAGFFTAFIAVKPHAIYLFWLVFLLWLIRGRRWQMFTGAVGGYFMAALVPLLLNPDVFLNYFEAMRSQRGAYHWATPTIGTYMRLFWGGEKEWLQFIPMGLGVSWMLFHWQRRRTSWNWIEETPLLLTISIMTSFYCWVNDYAMLLVPMIHAVAFMTRHTTVNVPRIFIWLYFLMNGVALIEYVLFPGEHHFIWFPATVLLLYLAIMKYEEKTFSAYSLPREPSA